MIFIGDNRDTREIFYENFPYILDTRGSRFVIPKIGQKLCVQGDFATIEKEKKILLTLEKNICNPLTVLCLYQKN